MLVSGRVGRDSFQEVMTSEWLGGGADMKKPGMESGLPDSIPDSNPTPTQTPPPCFNHKLFDGMNFGESQAVFF